MAIREGEAGLGRLGGARTRLWVWLVLGLRRGWGQAGLVPTGERSSEVTRSLLLVLAGHLVGHPGPV